MTFRLQSIQLPTHTHTVYTVHIWNVMQRRGRKNTHRKEAKRTTKQILFLPEN